MSGEQIGWRLEWRRVALESVAVVLSILLAFAIDALWDQHQDRDRERALLAAILADFQASRPGLVERQHLAERLADNTRWLLDRVSDSGRGATVTVPDSLILAVIGSPTYEAATDALDAALSSGEIELIRSDTIRGELAGWRRALIDTSEDEVEARRITNDQLVPALARALDLGPYFTRLLDWSLHPSDSDAGQPVTFRPPPETGSLLGARLFFVQFSADDLSGLLGSLDRTVDLLQADLGIR